MNDELKFTVINIFLPDISDAFVKIFAYQIRADESFSLKFGFVTSNEKCIVLYYIVLYYIYI